MAGVLRRICLQSSFAERIVLAGFSEPIQIRIMNGHMEPNLRGALIVFEGCDRSGKSTQCAKLAEKLAAEGKRVELMKFPDRTTPIGQMIDGYLRQTKELDDHTIHLLFSANRWEAMQKMTTLLQQGVTLIVDRYAYSGVAFTAAKGLDMQWCRQPDVGLIKPDKVIFMTVSGVKAAERSQFGEERYEKLEFQKRVREIYNQLQDSSYWQTVNGDASIDDVHKEVYNISVKTIEQSGKQQLLKLWTDGHFPVDTA